ncbi:MAG: hypothetical protein AAFU85_21465 [Planctomycetota bacterium]
MMPSRTGSLALLASLTFATSIWACKVPVFRYALERWPADRYTVVAIIDGAPDPKTEDALQALEVLRSSDANVRVEITDLSKLTEAEFWSVDGLENTDQVPVLQVFYPEYKTGWRRLCWSGDLTAENVDSWRHSPLREQIARKLRSGVSAVWVLIEGEDEAENSQSLRKLELALEEAQSKTTIPEGVIRRRDAASAFEQDATLSMDDVLRCDLPLRVEFSIVVLKHNDPTEWALRAMVQGLAEAEMAPCTTPVFGRGRMIEPLPMSSFNDESVPRACSYLFGECSCSVKALNPGIDLILDCNWRDLLGDEIIVSETGTATESGPITIPPGKAATRSMGEAKAPPSGRSSAAPARHSMIVILVAGALCLLIWSCRAAWRHWPS